MFLTPILAKTLLTDERTYYPLMAILPVVPVIAVSSVLRGYFQGKQNMKPSAYAQVLEQVVRITIIAICIQLFLPYGIEYAAPALCYQLFSVKLHPYYFYSRYFSEKNIYQYALDFHYCKGKQRDILFSDGYCPSNYRKSFNRLRFIFLNLLSLCKA